GRPRSESHEVVVRKREDRIDRASLVLEQVLHRDDLGSRVPLNAVELRERPVADEPGVEEVAGDPRGRPGLGNDGPDQRRPSSFERGARGVRPPRPVPELDRERVFAGDGSEQEVEAGLPARGVERRRELEDHRSELATRAQRLEARKEWVEDLVNVRGPRLMRYVPRHLESEPEALGGSLGPPTNQE